MQVERVQICSHKMLSRGFKASWFIPLVSDASVDDVLKSFAEYMATGDTLAFRAYPLLRDIFVTLMRSSEDCMFVFCRRWNDKVVGILRSSAPLCSTRERQLMQAIDGKEPWNMPLWTWTESKLGLSQSMEHQCRLRKVEGHCMGIWCYR